LLCADPRRHTLPSMRRVESLHCVCQFSHFVQLTAILELVLFAGYLTAHTLSSANDCPTDLRRLGWANRNWDNTQMVQIESLSIMIYICLMVARVKLVVLSQLNVNLFSSANGRWHRRVRIIHPPNSPSRHSRTVCRQPVR
jgi:hypothetical protein